MTLLVLSSAHLLQANNSADSPRGQGTRIDRYRQRCIPSPNKEVSCAGRTHSSGQLRCISPSRHFIISEWSGNYPADDTCRREDPKAAAWLICTITHTRHTLASHWRIGSQCSHCPSGCTVRHARSPSVMSRTPSRASTPQCTISPGRKYHPVPAGVVNINYYNAIPRWMRL
jgi:hypothetical protein